MPCVIADGKQGTASKPQQAQTANQRGIARGRTISELPRLSGSLKSDLVIRRMPSTQSSMKVKLRVCLPSPHISMSTVLVSTCIEQT